MPSSAASRAMLSSSRAWVKRSSRTSVRKCSETSEPPSTSPTLSAIASVPRRGRLLRRVATPDLLQLLLRRGKTGFALAGTLGREKGISTGDEVLVREAPRGDLGQWDRAVRRGGTDISGRQVGAT
jgi:hypothetical protein